MRGARGFWKEKVEKCTRTNRRGSDMCSGPPMPLRHASHSVCPECLLGQPGPSQGLKGRTRLIPPNCLEAHMLTESEKHSASGNTAADL